ncbi:YHS domain-containing (seleno)protein [Roseateles oligotrophus]|uniref:YHS domain protein n=1 Tax=Roseateles oligotrophus TaxID=1769250 RepID=A0ABT2YH26_9BURK|nr:YHS domain-containing (seleno)protein [Roseateles oligotrophus]MCV2369350.1 YHS domain protein [Roseateles oligotrophus]
MNTTSIARRSLLAALIIGAGLLATLPQLALAYEQNSTSELNLDQQGLALQGIDPVAYFTVGVPTAGKPEFTAKHRGASYRFASAANRDAFKADPNKFAPQYGGFCAMGVALDKKLDGDINAWKIVDNKLYLNVNKDVQKKWSEDIAGNLVKANSSWPEIKNRAPKDL